MDVHDRPKVLGRHFCKGLVSEDPRIVNQDVNAAEARHSVVDQTLGASLIRHAIVVRRRLAAARFYLCDDTIRRLGRSSRAIDGAAQIIDDHLRAA